MTPEVLLIECAVRLRIPTLLIIYYKVDANHFFMVTDSIRETEPAMFCVQKERKLLQVKRLDLDAAKTRLKKARMADARAAVSIHAHTHTCTILNATLSMFSI